MGLQRVLIASTSAALDPGVFVCPAVVAGKRCYTKATPAAVSAAKHVYGLMPVAADPNTYASVVVPPMTIDAAITGLGPGSISLVRLGSDARCERVTSFGDGDYAVGACDALGNLTLALGAAAEQALAGLSDDGTTIAVSGGVVSMRSAYKGKIDRSHIDVKADHGAVGDGVANDTAALTAAITAAAGRKLFLPAGTYLVDVQTVANAMHIVGDPNGGTTIKLRSSASHAIVVTADDVQLENVKIDGNSLISGGAAAVYSATSKRFRMRDCSVVNAPVAHHFGPGGSGTVQDCLFDVTGLTGVFIDDYVGAATVIERIRNSSPAGCPLVRFIPGTNTSRRAVFIRGCDWQQSSGNCLILSVQQPVFIEGNVFETDAIVSPTATYGVERVISRGNSWLNSGAVGYGSVFDISMIVSSQQDYFAP